MATTVLVATPAPIMATPAPIVEHVLTGHTDWVSAVATTELDGRPAAVSAGGYDGTLRIWDLTARTGS